MAESQLEDHDFGGNENHDFRRHPEPGFLSSEERGLQVKMPEVVYRAARMFARALCLAYFRVRVDGSGYIPRAGAVIVAPVHRSFIDFLVVGATATKRKVFFMAKDDLWHSKLLGSVLEAFGAFPVNRSGADRLALHRAQAVLENGDALILFPEGTRRTGRKVEDLHEGAAFLAARSGALIVPVGIGGTSAAMPLGAKVPRPVKVHLVVGEPIIPPERNDKGRVPRHEIKATTDELRGELQRLYDLAEPA